MLLKLNYSDKIREDQTVQRSNQEPKDQKDKSDDKEISKIHEERWFFGELSQRRWNENEQCQEEKVQEDTIRLHMRGLSQELAWRGLGWWRDCKGGRGRKVKRGRAGAKLAQMSLKRCYPGAEKTYLQRLNKTSLCQTIQGMAGHSLCGDEGWRKEGGGVRGRRREEEEGWKGREVGEEGWEGEGEKDSSVSLTWQVYHTSQWGETWRWRLGDEDGHGKPRQNTWQHGCDRMFFLLLVHACVRSGRSEAEWGPGVCCWMLALVRLNVQCRKEEAGAVESEGGDCQERQFGGCRFQGQQTMFSLECNVIYGNFTPADSQFR